MSTWFMELAVSKGRGLLCLFYYTYSENVRRASAEVKAVRSEATRRPPPWAARFAPPAVGLVNSKTLVPMSKRLRIGVDTPINPNYTTAILNP